MAPNASSHWGFSPHHGVLHDEFIGPTFAEERESWTLREAFEPADTNRHLDRALHTARYLTDGFFAAFHLPDPRPRRKRSRNPVRPRPGRPMTNWPVVVALWAAAQTSLCYLREIDGETPFPSETAIAAIAHRTLQVWGCCGKRTRFLLTEYAETSRGRWLFGMESFSEAVQALISYRLKLYVAQLASARRGCSI